MMSEQGSLRDKTSNLRHIVLKK